MHDELQTRTFELEPVLEAARARGMLKGYEACNDYVDRVWARPAYLSALERGGNYDYGPK